jgi:hypothetical protein
LEASDRREPIAEPVWGIDFIIADILGLASEALVYDDCH